MISLRHLHYSFYGLLISHRNNFAYNISKCKRHIVATITLGIFLLMMVGLTPTYACAQTNEMVLDVKNEKIVDILKILQSKYGYRFLYNNETLKNTKPITLRIKSKSIEKIISLCLKEQNLDFKISNRTILIKEKEPEKLIIINGVVKNNKGEGIPGVTIRVKGKNYGASTGIDGRFRIRVSPKNTSLIFSFIGMISQEVLITNTESLEIILEEDNLQMDEAVITGYNTIKQSSYTGNAITVKRDELLKASKTNIIKALQAFDPSLRIKESNEWGSDPNALPELYIRGESGIGVKELDKGSLSRANFRDNPNLPTFIMDGFEVNVVKLYDLDPNRIETITILKDAAATALYGSRAANGVIVITTVVPKNGKLNVDYSIVGSVTYPDLSDYNLTNASEKLEVERLAGAYDVIDDIESMQTDKYKLYKEYNNKLFNVKKGVDTYWLSQPLKTAFNHKHSLFINGGSNNIRFGVDLQYSNQDGVMRGSARDRHGAGFYIQYVFNNITIKNFASYARTSSKESPYGSFSTYTKQLPYDEIYDSKGRIKEELTMWSDASVFGGRVNPLYEPSLRNRANSHYDEFIDNLSMNWYIIPGLLLKGQFSITQLLSESENFIDPNSRYNINRLSLTNLTSGHLSVSSTNNISINANVTLSYNKAIQEHVINGLIGYNMMANYDTNSSSSYTGFPSGFLSSPNYAQRMDGKTGRNDSKRRLLGLIGSVNYTYKDTYLLDASVRIDGSSAFGANKRFAPFWSLGLGLNLHKYDFFKDIGFVDNLKIRGSYGELGKVNFPAYAARTTYMAVTDEWYKTGFGVKLQALGNADLKWETTTSLDFGFEIGVFRNLIYLRASYYDKLTKDLITDVTIPSHSGFTTYKENIGEVSNKGFEIDLRVSAIRKKDMSLYISANLGHNRNKILKISDSLKDYNRKVENRFNDYDETKPFLQYKEGGSLSSIYGVESLGINPANGQEVFLRPNGEKTAIWRASDQVVLGDYSPDVQGSISFNLTYKRFSLYASFMYEFGGQTYNSTLVNKVENVNIYRNNVDKRVLDGRWKQVGDLSKYKSILVGRNTNNITKPTSRFVMDNNVLSLNSLELGYDLPNKYTERIKLNMLRFTLGMNDLFYISSVKQERGLMYPFARTINFSIKASL